MNKLTMARKRPCNACRSRSCDQMACPRWQEWFLESWEGFHHYLWAQRDALGRGKQEKFCYELPHLVKSPCEVCPCDPWCDTPCSLRIQWWDSRMAILRKRGGGDAAR